MTPRLPNFDRCAQSPPVEDDFQGVRVVLPEKVDLSKDPSLPMFGAFQIPDEVAEAIPGGSPHRALVMLIVNTNGYHPYSSSVAGQAILFERAEAPEGMFRGYFNVDVFPTAQLKPQADRFFVSVYLDQFQSQPAAVVVEDGKAE